MKTSTLLLPSLFAALVACGGNTPEPNAPPSAPPAESAPAPAASAPATPAPASPTPGKAWGDMTHEERLAVMKSRVLPTMKEAFQKVDAKDFADFSCVTCHGPGIKQGKFDMPNPDLPKLNFKNGLADEKAKHPEVVKFMMETVVPQMAQMLNEPKFDPATKKGFGCGNCHTTVQ